MPEPMPGQLRQQYPHPRRTRQGQRDPGIRIKEQDGGVAAGVENIILSC